MEIYLTNIINPKSDSKCDLKYDQAIVILKGKIVESGDAFKILNKYNGKKFKLIDRSSYFCLPSFFDMHFHWVQDDVREMPKDSLLEWLSKYTWPYEAKFKSIDYTKKKAKHFKNELLKNGTLGGACYASLHPHSVDEALGQFTGDYIVGNVLMTMNSPEYLVQTESNAIETVKKLSTKYKNKYAMTPRFAITTSPKVMEESAKIANKNKSFIQTHLSETENEIDFVLSIYKKIKNFEKVKNYTEIYYKSKTLGPKTIMGHGIYLSNDELKLLSKTRTSICHCPTSNAPVKEKGLGSGLFDFERTEKLKVKWALGSDIGGGPFLSMFDVMRSFVEQNKKAKKSKATFVKALYRATMSGAEILELSKSNGNLDKNKFANMIFVERNKISLKDPEKVLAKIISKNKTKRHLYESLVKETIFKGEAVYSSISK